MSEVGECECAPKASIDLRHQPVRQGADATLKGAPVDRGDLCDIDDRIGFNVGGIGWHRDIARERGELSVAREHNHSDGA